MGKLEGKTPLGRPRRGWEDNIKIDLQEVGYGDVDWIDKIEKNEMGWACGAYDGGERRVQGFGGET